MKYKETLEYMQEINKYGSVLGLALMSELMRRLGNPQNDLKVLHVAGTNGKGSTIAFLSSILIESGEKVGQYTSPSVFEYLEKIKINEKMISKRTFASYITKIKLICNEMVKDGFSHPTSFEIETAVAFSYFKDQKCSVSIIETGLGGERDATNVMSQSKVCVFTSVSIDHMEFLGDTVEKIAKEKSGIISEESIVILGNNEKSVNHVFQKEINKKKATSTELTAENIKIINQSMELQIFSYKSLNELKIQMKGAYQIENACLAIEVIHTINKYNFIQGKKISNEQIRTGLYKANWMGRFSIISRNPLFIIDGAHNEAASIKLKETMELYFTKSKIIYIIGILKDKEYKKIIENMGGLANQIITVSPPHNERAFSAYNLAQEIQKVNPMVTVADSLEEAVEMAYLLADKDSVILAFGSLSYLGKLTEVVNNKDEIWKDSHGKIK